MGLPFSTEEALGSPIDNATRNLRDLRGSDLTFRLEIHPFVRGLVGLNALWADRPL